jgi:hypothetical protein
MSTPNYRLDPILKNIGKTDFKYRQQAKEASIECQLIDMLSFELFQTNVVNKNKVVITNTIFTDAVFDTIHLEQLPSSFYGIYYHNYDLKIQLPSKSYNCFINRIDPNRQSWFYLLIKRGILDQGYVSFNLDISRTPYYKKLTPLEAFEYQFQNFLLNFKEQHQISKTIVPYCNFSDTSDLSTVIMDSKFSIVLETFFNDNRGITYSEKIFRCLQLPRPWVLYGQQHAVHYLRLMGFDVLDDLIDHNYYDVVDFEINRQHKILNLSEDLCNYDITKHYDRLIEAAQHNQNLLLNFSAAADKDFEDALNKAKDKLSTINAKL